MKRQLAIAAGLAVLLTCWGCAQKHLTSSHGYASEQAFTEQTVDTEAGQDPPQPRGLDPQEAAIVVDNYHDSLQKEGSGEESEEQVLLITPPKKKQGSNMPPPSVPPDQK